MELIDLQNNKIYWQSHGMWNNHFISSSLTVHSFILIGTYLKLGNAYPDDN